MRRSAAPSVKRLKLTAGSDQENQPPAGGSQSSGGKFGTLYSSQPSTQRGFLGTTSGLDAPDAATQYSQPTNSQQIIQQHAAAATLQPPVFRQFKCPLPYGASSAGPRGTLGAKKSYAGATDILAAMQRRVVLVDSGQDQAGSSNAVSELVLYDPDEHKLQWLAQQEAADAAPQVEPPAALPPTAPSAPTTSASAAAAAPAAGAAGPAGGASGGERKQPDMAWEKRVKVYADPFLVEKLRPHQREGVKFVFECLSGVRQQGVMGAVLADGMGLGKTFQTIASLYCLLTKGVFGQPTCRKPLILCPTSLVQNWGKEVTKWLGDRLDTVVVGDTKADKVKKFLQDFRGFSRTGKPKVLVMSYPCFRGHKAEVYKLGIDVLMCDEAHFLKNGEAQITQAVAGLQTAQRRLLMSGTPVQNRLDEFHAVFDLACPGLLGTLNTFRKVYEGPIQRGRDADATEKQVELGMQRMNELMKLCNRFMLRRTSTMLKELLPTKVEQVVFCRLSKLQLKLYEHFLQSKPVKALLASTLGEDGGPPRKRKSAKPAATQAADGQPAEQQPEPEQQQELLAPLAAITALKKLCCHPDLIWDMLHKHKAAQLKTQQAEQLALLRAAQKRVSARSATQAPRDYSKLALGGDDDDEEEEEGAKATAASKKRTSKKAAGSASARQQLTGFEGCTHLFGDGDVYPAYQQSRCQAFHSGKVMVLEALLKSIRTAEPTDKVVLVSNYTEALDVLAVMCASHNWVALRLDGSCNVKQRQTLVDTFNDPKHPSFVLLLSSKAGGVGLNIIGANRLVLFDPDWNPANDLQAMARVWREGQAKRVWIYRMLMAGSIEEKVLQRQLAKQGLSEALVDEVGQEVRTFSRDELRSLFKVNPNIPCETHTAIKCTCDGSLEAMACCKERAATVAGAGSGDDAAEQQGILGWAHLARALDSPDPTWGTMSNFVRDNFVTYVFSDHVLGEQSSAGVAKAAAAAAGAGKQRAARSGVDSGSEAEEEEDEEENEEEQAPAGRKPVGPQGPQQQQRQQQLPASSQQGAVAGGKPGLGGTAAAAAAGPPAAAAGATGGKGAGPAGRAGSGSRRATGKRSAPEPDSDSDSEAADPCSGSGPDGKHTADETAGEHAGSKAKESGLQQQQGATVQQAPDPEPNAAAPGSSAGGPAAPADHTATAAEALLLLGTTASEAAPDSKPQATGGRPPRSKPSAAAATAAKPGHKSKAAVPAAARRRSGSSVPTGSQAAEAATSGKAGAAGRRRNSAPAATKSSGKAGSKQAKADATAAAATLSAFAFNGLPAGQPAADGTTAAAQGELPPAAAGGGGDGLGGDGSPLCDGVDEGQLHALVSDLCPQLSDPLDDTPMMGLGDDSDGDFM